MGYPQTVGELMQLYPAVNWLLTSLPRLAEVVEPRRVLLKEHMGGVERQAARVPSNRLIAEEAWNREQVALWSNAQDLVANVIRLITPNGRV